MPVPVPVIAGLLGRAGIAGAKHLSKKAARKAAQEEVKNSGVGEIAAMGLGGGAASAAINRLQIEQMRENRALAERKRAERERAEKAKTKEEKEDEPSYRKGGSVKSSASRRADGIAQRGKTRGKFV